MLFYHDKYSAKSGVSQYEDFLDNQVYLHQLRGNVKDITNYQLLELRKSISASPLDMRNSIEKTIACVSGTLESGFTQLNKALRNINQGVENINLQLSELSEGLSELYSLFDERTTQIIEQQKIANDFLQIIAKAAFMDDDRIRNNRDNKIGNGFLKSAIEENAKSPFYTEALEAFTSVLKKDGYDHTALHQLGFIYLKSKKHLDLERARSLFVKSATIALALESESLGIAASALYYESICSYILEDVPRAIGSVRKALSLLPNKLKYRFQLAKCLAANGNGIEASEVLKDIILGEPLYSVKILEDQDLASNEDIQDMLEKELLRVTRMVDEEIEKIETFLASNPHLPSEQLMDKIEEEYHPITYLSARTAMKKLEI